MNTPSKPTRNPETRRRARAAASLLLAAAVAGGVAPLVPAQPQAGGPPPSKPRPFAPGPGDGRDFDARNDQDGARGDERRDHPGGKEKLKRKAAALDAFRAKLSREQRRELRAELHHNGLPKILFSYDGAISSTRRGRPEEVARGFLREHAELFDLSPREVDALSVEREAADEGVTFVHHVQRVNGLKVYGSHIKTSVSAAGEVLSVSEGEVLPGASVDTRPSVSETDAIARAFGFAGAAAPVGTPRAVRDRAEAGGRAVFENPLDPSGMRVLSDLVILPFDGAGLLAWRVLADAGPAGAFEVLVDARTGELLKRTSLRHDAQGTVYTANPNRTPTRTAESFDGGTIHGQFRGPWLFGGETRTLGNNVQAYLDVDDDGAPDDVAGNGLDGGFASSEDQDFTFPHTTGSDPRVQQAAAVANVFYFCNAAHDFTYGLGFSESFGNFQFDNFGAGGEPYDPVRAEAQDGGERSNAHMTCWPDGERPLLEVGIWTRNTPSLADDRDGDVDGDIVLHEYGHGVNNRLIASEFGDALGGPQSDALDEGWADYFAATFFSDGVVGDYVSGDAGRGIRRSAYGVASAANDSYADLGAPVWEPHNDGEVWCQTLWEIRQTLGPKVADRIVVYGMKCTPDSPSFVNARDGILTADRDLYASMNRTTLWAIFARHGLGASASGNDGYTHNAAYDTYVSVGRTNWASCGAASAGSLAISDPRSARRPSCYKDTWTYNAEAGVPVTFNMDSTAFDTYMYVYDRFGTLIFQDDDSGPGYNSQITFTPPTDTTYTIETTSYGANVTGAYTLTTRCDKQRFLPCGGPALAGTFVAADPISALRPQGPYADHFYFTGYPGMTVTVTMTATSGGVDPYLYLIAPSGAVVAEDDDGAGYPNSRMTATLTESGTYVVEATEYSIPTTGSYSVVMACN